MFRLSQICPAVKDALCAQLVSALKIRGPPSVKIVKQESLESPVQNAREGGSAIRMMMRLHAKLVHRANTKTARVQPYV